MVPVQPRDGAGLKAKIANWLGERKVTVVLNRDLHERLMAAALDTGQTMQALIVEGAEMVLAQLENRQPQKVRWTPPARLAVQRGGRVWEQDG